MAKFKCTRCGNNNVQSRIIIIYNVFNRYGKTLDKVEARPCAECGMLYQTNSGHTGVYRKNGVNELRPLLFQDGKIILAK